MARYILSDNFVQLNETFGTVINISNFRAVLSCDASNYTGATLFPRHKLSFTKTLYAARAPGEDGVPVIATLPFTQGSDSFDGNDEFITEADLDKIFGGSVYSDEFVYNHDIENIFNGSSSVPTFPSVYDDESISDEDLNNIFNLSISDDETISDEDLDNIFH